MLPSLLELIRAALREDLPHGDLTTESLALSPRWGRAQLLAKENLVLSGSVAFEESFRLLEPSVDIHWHFRDGDAVVKGQIVASLQGDLLQILKAERVALNFLGHLSGVASLTRAYVDKVRGTKTKILDTRKTLPVYRDLEKRAVRDGGGHNHRLSLSDAILIKENHVAVAGGITAAIERLKWNVRLLKKLKRP
jgi:nicotinate-nucleotide pyrophosphorylase (carboxylating)